jgi:Zn-dependent protease/CBS domain-containing protein
LGESSDGLGWYRLGGSMTWSWKIGRVAGIDVRVHATFILLLAWVALVFYRESGTAAGAARGVLFTLALFASVVAHEFGHALVARRFGVPTKNITLLPIGGVARLEYIPDRPKQEFWIAIAGPAVTLGIVGLLYLMLRVLGSAVIPASAAVGGTRAEFLAQLFWVNVTLLLFNLLPAFPMDGGRVLRAVLALHMDYLRATDLAARVGRSFALLFGVVGVFYNPFLVLIALFVWLGAASESSALHVRSSLAGVNVERVMVREVSTLAPTDTLDTALTRVLGGFQHDFPVVQDGKVLGVLTRSALLNALARHSRESLVSVNMEQSFRVAEPSEPVEAAVARLRECQCRSLPVVRDGRLCGLLTLDNIGEFVTIADALRTSAAAIRDDKRLTQAR